MKFSIITPNFRNSNWSHRDGENDEGERFVTVLEISPVVSPQTAVQAVIVADTRKKGMIHNLMLGVAFAALVAGLVYLGIKK